MLPKAPVILLSVINTKLRDFYPSLTISRWTPGRSPSPSPPSTVPTAGSGTSSSEPDRSPRPDMSLRTGARFFLPFRPIWCKITREGG